MNREELHRRIADLTRKVEWDEQKGEERMSETKDQGRQRPDIEPLETGQGAPISEGQGELFGFMQKDIEEMTNPEPISYGTSINTQTNTDIRQFSAILKEWTTEKDSELLGHIAKWSDACKWLTEEAQRQRPDKLSEWGTYPAPRYEVVLSQAYELIAVTTKKRVREFRIHKPDGPVRVRVKFIPDYTPPLTAEAAEDLQAMLEAFERRREQGEQEKKAGTLLLPSLQSIHPEKAVMANSKVANSLSRLHETAGQRQPVIVSQKKGAEVRVVVKLDYDAKNLHASKKISAYDREVHNAICTLWEAGNAEFTPTMVYRAMNGLQECERVTQESIERVSESINKLRHTHMTIDCTDQVKEWRLPKQKEGNPLLKFDDSMLSVMGVRMRNHNGEEIEAYRFNTTPILYSYSKQIGHVLTVPMRVLNTKKRLRTTEEVTTIRAYLIRRIQAMQGKNGIKARQIRYETIMEEAGINLDGLSNQRNKKKAVMDQVDAILQHFQEEGEIGSARRYKEGRADAGVEIELPDK